MLLFVIIDKENLYKKIAEWKNLHKAVMNNYYGVDDDSFYEICETEHSLLIRKKEFHFYRLYVLTDDVNDLENSLKNLTGSEYAINSPSKTPIDNWDVLLRNSGFEFLDVYSRYYNNSIRTFPTEIDTFAEYDEIGDIASLLYANFSLYTDHLPSKKELEQMVANRQIITDHKDGKVCGVLIYSVIGNKGYQNAWIDTGGNGLGLLFKVKSIFIEKGIKYCYYWIKDTNTPVIKMHTMMGGKTDGLKDYNYLKK